MAYDKRTYLYEILLRFGPEGLAGSHVIDMEEVYDTKTGEVLTAKELEARPIAADEVGEYLGKANAKAVEQLASANAALAEERASLQVEATTVDRRRQDLAGLAAAIAADFSPVDKDKKAK